MAAEPFSAIGPVYDVLMRDVPYREWVDYVESLVRLWHGTLARVVDLACGTGNVGLELARRGCRVLGVDRVQSMLLVGRQKATAAGLPMAFVRQDLRALGLQPLADVIVCLFDSLNYLLDREELRAACRGARRALRAGGLFVFDVNTELALARELFSQERLEADAPLRLRWRSRYDRGSRTATVAMEFYLDDGRVLSEVHQQRAFSAKELRWALSGAGFETLAVHDAYTYDLPQSDSDRLFYVCRAAASAP